MSNDIKKKQVYGTVPDEQLNSIGSRLQGDHAEEFEAGLGYKGLSGGLSSRHAEEFEAGLGHKGLANRHAEEFEAGLRHR